MRSATRAMAERKKPAFLGALAVAVLVPWSRASESQPQAEIDPRIEIAAPMLDGNAGEALRRLRRARSDGSELWQAYGFDYLEGHLLSELNRQREAMEAFARTIAATPVLASHARLRMARLQEQRGHPEVAAGLIATALASGAPRSIVETSSRLLYHSLAAGGDCRLLNGIRSATLPTSARRYYSLGEALCASRQGDATRAERAWLHILRERVSDLTAHEAAEQVALLFGEREVPKEVETLLGSAFHFHRDFDRAAFHLENLVGDYSPPLRKSEFESYYQLVRSYFWLGRFEAAAERYGELATLVAASGEQAQSYYQRGRALELAGHRGAALESYNRSFRAQPLGNWSAAALIASLRLEWLAGHETRALELYEALRQRPQWRFELSRAALFLASSDIVLGRSDRASQWLDDSALVRSARLETLYWRGRLSELTEEPVAAVNLYADILLEESFHPIALAARHRLAQESLQKLASAKARVLLRTAATDEDLHRAFVLAPEPQVRERAAALLADRLRESMPAAVAFLDLSDSVSLEEWPLWGTRLSSPEEILLGLGIFAEGAPAVLRHFPVATPSLAATGARQLNRAREYHDSLRVAEILLKRVPGRLPSALLPRAFRELLYPFAFRPVIELAGEHHGIDSRLLAALIREESRFDPHAESAASARGLTQFVLPTAQRIAEKLKLEALAPEDLEQPAMAIELGAAYIAELDRHFDGQRYAIIAAYNAGEVQAELWRSYCASHEPEEFYSKVTFRETRGYLSRVAASHAQYLDLYGSSP